MKTNNGCEFCYDIEMGHTVASFLDPTEECEKASMVQLGYENETGVAQPCLEIRTAILKNGKHQSLIHYFVPINNCPWCGRKLVLDGNANVHLLN